MTLPRILEKLSLDEAWKHLYWIEKNAPARISGTPDQERAGEYFAEQLSEYGLETQLDTFTAYRSVPTRGALAVTAPIEKEFACEPCGHIESTPDEGIEVEFLYLGPGSEKDYSGNDVKGKAVFTEISSGPSRPKKARIAADHGAAAIVFINWGLPEFGTIPCGAIKCVWGNPTRATLADVPQIAALGIGRAAGDQIIELLEQGQVFGRITAQATRDWGPLTQPWGRIRAPLNRTGDFLLVAGHYDAWRPGMTDNASGNSLMLELARVFASERDRLTRDIIFGFWNGHEIGDYEGSTWFADRYWDDIDSHGIAYFNVDSVGFTNSSFYMGDSTPELEQFHKRIEQAVLGVATAHRHLTRDNEHPFFGIGLPALEGRFHFSNEQIADWGGARGGWWWHSRADTIDKIDRDRYGDTARIWLGYVWEMCTNPVLPMDFSSSASRIDQAITKMQQIAGGRFELDLPFDSFAAAAKSLSAAIESMDDEDQILRVNQTLKRLSRILLPAFETVGGRYEQDLYEHEGLQSAIPALHELRRLAATPESEDLAHLLHTELMRQRNRLSDALRWATTEILEAIE